ncbi:MAG: MFS transporter [Psychrobacter sp.]|nr:MFS transporter [Psychrobacter sp.]
MTVNDSVDATEPNFEHQPKLPSEPPMSLVRQWMAILSVSFGAFALVTSEFLPVGILTLIAQDLISVRVLQG